MHWRLGGLHRRRLCGLQCWHLGRLLRWRLRWLSALYQHLSVRWLLGGLKAGHLGRRELSLQWKRTVGWGHVM